MVYATHRGGDLLDHAGRLRLEHAGGRIAALIDRLVLVCQVPRRRLVGAHQPTPRHAGSRAGWGAKRAP